MADKNDANGRRSILDHVIENLKIELNVLFVRAVHKIGAGPQPRGGQSLTASGTLQRVLIF